MNETRRCSKCLEYKDIQYFGKNKTRTDGLQIYCKECAKKYMKNYYESNHSKHVAAVLKIKQKNKIKIKEFILEYLRDNPCVDCGESRIPTLDFDHVRGNKNKAVAYFLSVGAELKKVQEEISKCEVRCANCHRRKTYRDFGSYRFSD